MILRIAHVELTVDDLAAAREFYVELLGFVEHEADASTLYLRAAEEFDAWSLKLTAGEGLGLVHSAFRVAAPADLDALERLHAQLGVPAVRVPAGREPAQGEALRVRAPTGHAIELLHDFDEIAPGPDGRLRLPMRTLAHRHGIPPTRIDHVSHRVPDMAAALDYWVDALDFSLSEMWMEADGTPRIAWARRSGRSHDLALGAGEAAAFHHIAYAVSDANALMRAADLIADAGLAARIEWGPSRHGATNALALYVRDPAGNRLELTTGDYLRDLDRPPLRWEPEDYARGGHSWWGWLPPDVFRETLPLRDAGWPGTA